MIPGKNCKLVQAGDKIPTGCNVPCNKDAQCEHRERVHICCLVQLVQLCMMNPTLQAGLVADRHKPGPLGAEMRLLYFMMSYMRRLGVLRRARFGHSMGLSSESLLLARILTSSERANKQQHQPENYPVSKSYKPMMGAYGINVEISASTDWQILQC